MTALSPRRRAWAALTVSALIAVGLPAAARSATQPACSQSTSGGDWAAYGQDLHGSQDQRAEHTIGVRNVATLKQRWITGDTGYQSPPPIVANGCVFINTGGHIEAFSLSTGRVLWTSQGADTTGTFAVTVVDGRVHVGLGNGGRPKAAAFDEHTGHLLWTSGEVYFGYQTTQQASAVVFDGLQVLFTTGPDFDPKAEEGYGIIDAATGKLLYKTTTIPPAQIANGYHGGGVWGTPSVDPLTKYLYVGSSNPESKTKESRYDDAILKIDLDRTRPTFGKVVGTYKGTRDTATGYQNPVCQTVGGTAWVNGGIYGGSPTCGQLDVDFGVGPTMWRDRTGRLLGAATQKSGWLHVFDATTMRPVWKKQLFLNTSFAGGNLARIATDGQTLYVAANPGVLYAFDATTFATKWRTPLTGIPMKGGNVAVANGVVYYVDEPALKAFSAATGRLLWVSQPEPSYTAGSGVAVAGHTVIANHYGKIAAYRLP
jgi:polyvinyl alcohol dehydrogenase (cytochrome)